MSLDVTAYERVTLTDHSEPMSRTEVRLYVDTPGRTQHDGMPDGVYLYEGERFHFAAGSCGGYGEWRESLARLVGTTVEDVWEEGSEGPFVELIDFADNEGFIGPVTAAKLAQDFDDWDDRAKAVDSWFYERYTDWRRAFHVAAREGAGVVKLH